MLTERVHYCATSCASNVRAWTRLTNSGWHGIVVQSRKRGSPKLRWPRDVVRSATLPWATLSYSAWCGASSRSVNPVTGMNKTPTGWRTRWCKKGTIASGTLNSRTRNCVQRIQLARSVNDLAFMAGGNIVFAAGQYRPRATEGERLGAHELTHVVQQSNHTSYATIQRQEPEETQTAAAKIGRGPRFLEWTLDRYNSNGSQIAVSKGKGSGALWYQLPRQVGRTIIRKWSTSGPGDPWCGSRHHAELA